MNKTEKQTETPLTASVDKTKNISTLKVLYTNRVNRYSDAGLSDVLKPDFPWTVGISPTSCCPRQCFFCSHSQRNQLGFNLSEHVMQQIHADMKSMGVKGVIYAGGGDPFAWEYEIVSFMKMAATFCCIGIDTNGVLARKILASNVATKIFYITFALLGHNADLYKRVCGRDQFRIVDDNIRLLANRKKEAGSHYPHINVKLSINRLSYRHIIDMWRYANDLGVDNIFARCMNNFEENQDIELTSEQKKELYDLIACSFDFPEDYKYAFAQNLVYPAQFTGHLPSRCWSVLLGHNLGIKQDGECYLCVP
ncbi:MAG: radical SAM protein, partial [Chloroflexota bacterium]